MPATHQGGQITVDVTAESLVELDESLTVLLDNLQAGASTVNLVGTGTGGVGAWTQLGGDIDGVAAGDKFGLSVAMSADGNTVVRMKTNRPTSVRSCETTLIRLAVSSP